ncbi:MAG: sulfotransferase domain-containing protein, partial [Ardenticatenaceae bacterium]
LDEVLESQRAMLQRRDQPSDPATDGQMKGYFEQHVGKVAGWLDAQPNFAVLYVDYNDLLANPQPYVERIAAFLGGTLDSEAMIEVVDPALYRNRQG